MVETIGQMEAAKFEESLVYPKRTIRTLVTNTNPLPTYVDFQWDEVDQTEPTTSSEVYTFKLSSVVVKTITLTYFDSTKSRLINVTKV